MNALYDRIQETIAFLRLKTDFQPLVGIILGTGLSGLSDEIEPVAVIPYRDIPHFPVSTVASHKGQMVFGYLSGKPVVALAGRFHYYEGYTMQQITFPVRVLKALGVELLMVSNAAGSTQGHIHAGDLVFLKDHINLQADNPLRGPNDERLGPRFPDMLHTYDRKLNARALELAAAGNIRAHEGVYVALQGPNMETPAEYVFMHRIGADVVGMSTVPEVLVAKHSGMRIFAVSVVSNQSYPPEIIQESSLEEVIAVVQSTEPKLRGIIRALLSEISL